MHNPLSLNDSRYDDSTIEQNEVKKSWFTRLKEKCHRSKEDSTQESLVVNKENESEDLLEEDTKNYQYLKKHKKITFTKLKDKNILQQFRKTGEMTTVSNIIKKFLDQLDSIPYKFSCSYKTGVFLSKNNDNNFNKLFVVDFEGEFEYLNITKSADELELLRKEKEPKNDENGFYEALKCLFRMESKPDEIKKIKEKKLEESLFRMDSKSDEIKRIEQNKPKEILIYHKNSKLEVREFQGLKIEDIIIIQNSLKVLFSHEKGLYIGFLYLSTKEKKSDDKYFISIEKIHNMGDAHEIKDRKLANFSDKGTYLNILFSKEENSNVVFFSCPNSPSGKEQDIYLSKVNEKHNISVEKRTSSMIYIESKKVLVIGTRDGEIFFYDTTIKERKFRLQAHFYNISKLIYLDEGKIISFSGDKSIKITNLPKKLSQHQNKGESPKKLFDIKLHEEPKKSKKFKSDKNQGNFEVSTEARYEEQENEKISRKQHEFRKKQYYPELSDEIESNSKYTAFCRISKQVSKGKDGKYYFYWIACDNREIHIRKQLKENEINQNKLEECNEKEKIDIKFPKIHTIKCTNGVSMYLKTLHAVKESKKNFKNEFVLSFTMLGIVNCYSSKTFTVLVTIKLFGPIKEILVEDYNIFYRRYPEYGKSSSNDLYKYQLKIRDVHKLPIEPSEEEMKADGKSQQDYKTARLIYEQELKEFYKNELNDISIIGPDDNDFFQVCDYINKILNDKKPEFNKNFDKWIILPYLISPIHLYAHMNMNVHIAKSLENGMNLNETTERQSALTIAVSKDYEDCVSIIMKNLKYKVMENPYFIDFLGDNELIEMNFNGRQSLSLFYNLMLTKINQNGIKRFALRDAELPYRKCSKDIITDFSKEFEDIFKKKESSNEKNNQKLQNLSEIKEEEKKSTEILNEQTKLEYKHSLETKEKENKITKAESSNQKKNEDDEKTGKSIVFSRSLFKISQKNGDKRSVDLIRSFIECENNEIFRSPFVINYIELKFEAVKYFIWFEIILYLIYLILLCIYILFDNRSPVIVFIPLFVGVILSIFEIFRAIASGSAYLKNPWNILNFIRSVLFYIFLGLTYKFDIENDSIRSSDSINYPLLLLFLLSFVRGVLMFRIFDKSRYFLELLRKVMISSFAFMMVMIYVLIVFSLILLQASTYADTIGTFLGSGFLIVTGALDPIEQQYNIPEWLTFLVAVVLLTWIMMNLLVAIYNDAFATVYNYKDIYKYKSKAIMAYEIEMILSLGWKYSRRIFNSQKDDPQNQNNDKTRYSELTYLYVTDEKVWKEEKTQVLSKISKSKLDIRRTIKDINETKSNIDKLSDFNKKMREMVEKIEKNKHIKEKNALGIESTPNINIFNQEQEKEKDIERRKLADELFKILLIDALEPTYDYGNDKIEQVAEKLNKIIEPN